MASGVVTLNLNSRSNPNLTDEKEPDSDEKCYYYVEYNGVRYMTMYPNPNDIILEKWYHEKYVNKLTKALTLYEKERDRFAHNYPEISGEYFLAGGSGSKDENHMPEEVLICPAYGADWVQLYKKTNKIVNFSGS